jgi:hypothetical protein
LFFFSFISAAILLSAIGLQIGLKNEFLKSLLHGYTITLIFAIFSSISRPIVAGAGLRDIAFLTGIFLNLFWIFLIYAAITGVVLFFVRKFKTKKYLYIGYGIVIVVLGAGFCVVHYLIARAVIGAIYIGIMINH